MISEPCAIRLTGSSPLIFRDSFFADSVLKKGAKNVFSYRCVEFDHLVSLASFKIISWNAPDTVLYNAKPYLGAMHTSDLYYLFSGKL